MGLGQEAAAIWVDRRLAGKQERRRLFAGGGGGKWMGMEVVQNRSVLGMGRKWS